MLSDKFDRFENLTRANNLTLAGVPVKRVEDLAQFIINLGKFIGHPFDGNEFDAFRLESSNASVPVIIIIKLTSIETRDRFCGLYLDQLESHNYISLASIDYSDS